MFLRSIEITIRGVRNENPTQKFNYTNQTSQTEKRTRES